MASALHMSAFDPKRTWRDRWNLRKVAPQVGDMRRRGKAIGPSGKGAVRLKARKATAANELTKSLREQVAALTHELREARDQQTASSEVLKVISARLRTGAGVSRKTSERNAPLRRQLRWHVAMGGRCIPRRRSSWRSAGRVRRPLAWRGTLFQPGPNLPMARAIKTRQPVQINDLRATEAYREGHPMAVAGVDVAGIRSMVAVPMFKENKPMAFSLSIAKRYGLHRQAGRACENFAEQAVIAIENARLLNDCNSAPMIWASCWNSRQPLRKC